ncbi:MAG: 3-deoxy-7-phosphoheptulonate synthase, partial [Clostridia bacterium]|nr:3-deoxy-7-phosphoheptulonate synthase [Clostridia bacterium]
GQSIPNYHYGELLRLHDMYAESHLQNPGVIIDTNHANSDKKPLEQPRIIKDVLQSCKWNPDVKKLVKGFMVESYIEDGAQSVDGGIYGKSITDPCLGWEKSERLVLEVADML